MTSLSLNTMKHAEITCYLVLHINKIQYYIQNLIIYYFEKLEHLSQIHQTRIQNFTDLYIN